MALATPHRHSRAGGNPCRSRTVFAVVPAGAARRLLRTVSPAGDRRRFVGGVDVAPSMALLRSAWSPQRTSCPQPFLSAVALSATAERNDLRTPPRAQSRSKVPKPDRAGRMRTAHAGEAGMPTGRARHGWLIASVHSGLQSRPRGPGAKRPRTGTGVFIAGPEHADAEAAAPSSLLIEAMRGAQRRPARLPLHSNIKMDSRLRGNDEGWRAGMTKGGARE